MLTETKAKQFRMVGKVEEEANLLPEARAPRALGMLLELVTAPVGCLIQFFVTVCRKEPIE